MAVRRSYPLSVRGKIIGRPGQGTHSFGAPPNNWQSDRAYDLAVAKGTPVLAIWDGVIGPRIGSLGPSSDRFGGIRVYVDVRRTSGEIVNSYYYAHLSKLAPGIKAGVRVRAGQVIGYSGIAAGVPHLHVAVMNGSPATKLLGGTIRGRLRQFGAAIRRVKTDAHEPIVEPK